MTINLTRPDAEFFHKLALPHAVILPADAPTKDVGHRLRFPAPAPT